MHFYKDIIIMFNVELWGRFEALNNVFRALQSQNLEGVRF
jgi:hypothetical protein